MTAVDAGGHYLDTGDGPVCIDPPVGRAAEGPVRVAWRAYLDHRRDCTPCATSALGCDVAAQLWTDYTDSRSDT